MGSNRCLSAIFFLLLMLFANSAFISDDVLKSGECRYGRSLLQAKQNCPADFENANYTVLTSQCKGPNYSPDMCCPAFTEFACRYRDEINDLRTNCAETMFSYLNLRGYPAGLFSNTCQGDKGGLPCPASPPAPLSDDANGGHAAKAPFLLLLTVEFSLLLLAFHIL